MKVLYTAVAVMFCLTPAVRGDDENPFRKAKVGDWAEYKMSGSLTGTTKMVVTSKTDKELVYEITSKSVIMGKSNEVPPQKITVDLTKKYDPFDPAKLPKADGAKVERTEGKEKIKVGDKEYDCTWTSIKTSMKINDMVIESEVKNWISKDGPLGGSVKTLVKSPFGDTTVELSGYGSK